MIPPLVREFEFYNDRSQYLLEASRFPNKHTWDGT